MTDVYENRVLCRVSDDRNGGYNITTAPIVEKKPIRIFLWDFRNSSSFFEASTTGTSSTPQLEQYLFFASTGDEVTITDRYGNKLVHVDGSENTVDIDLKDIKILLDKYHIKYDDSLSEKELEQEIREQIREQLEDIHVPDYFPYLCDTDIM